MLIHVKYLWFQSAIEEAIAADVDKNLIQRGEEELAELERQKEIVDRLLKVTEEKDESGLETALRDSETLYASDERQVIIDNAMDTLIHIFQDLMAVRLR